MDFPVERGEDPTEKIDAAIRDLQPDKTKQVAVSFGKKNREDKFVSCFVEFFGDFTDEQVLTEDMIYKDDPVLSEEKSVG